MLFVDDSAGFGSSVACGATASTHTMREVAGPAGEAWLAVRDLPARQRQVIVLRYVADLAESDIAGLLGISRSAVSSALSDGRRSLALVLVDAAEEVPYA